MIAWDRCKGYDSAVTLVMVKGSGKIKRVWVWVWCFEGILICRDFLEATSSY